MSTNRRDRRVRQTAPEDGGDGADGGGADAKPEADATDEDVVVTQRNVCVDHTLGPKQLQSMLI